MLLLKIKEKATGWVAYGIVFLIAVPFAFWGIQQYFGLATDTEVAVVGSEKIQLNRFEQAVIEKRRELELSGISNVSELQLRRETIEEFISQAVLSETVKDLEYYISDDFLAQSIRLDSSFWDDGRFSRDSYLKFLQSKGVSPSWFESQFKRQLEENGVIDSVRNSSFVLPFEQQHFERLLSEERSIRYLEPAIDNFPLQYGKLQESDLLVYYEDHQDDYRSPLMLRLKFLEISLDGLIEEEVISPAGIEAYFEEHQDEYLVPESRDFRSIVLSHAEDDEDRSVEDRLQEIREKLSAGETFQSLASVYSDDASGGQSGLVEDVSEYDIEDDTVRAELFSLQEGEISSSLETDNGIQILMVENIHPPVVQSLEDVSEDISYLLRQVAATEKYTALQEKVEELAYELQDDFWDEAVDELALSSSESDWLNFEQRDGVLAHDEIRNLIEQNSELLEQQNSGVVEVEGGRGAVVFKIQEIQRSRLLVFADVREQIAEDLARNEAEQRSRRLMDEEFKELAAGKTTFQGIMQDYPGLFDVFNLGYVKRYAAVSPDILDVAFILAKEKIKDRPQFSRIGISPIIPQGAIIEVSNIRLLDAQEDDLAASSSLSQREVFALLQSVRAALDIQVNEKVIQGDTDDDR